MARAFAAASTQSLVNSSTAIISGMPFTMACWFSSNDAANIYALMAVGQSSNLDDFYVLQARGDQAGDPIFARQAQGGSAAQGSAGTFSANTWSHAAAVFTSTTSRTAYFNGTAGTTNTTSITAPTVSNFAVGALVLSSTSQAFDGKIAEAGIWSVSLDAAEIAALAKGVCPTLIRPQSLLAYWPLFGNLSPEQDRWRSKIDLTLTNTPTKATDHARIYYPHQVSGF